MLTSLRSVFIDIYTTSWTSLGPSIWGVCDVCPTVSQFSHNRPDSLRGETSPGTERSAGTQKKCGGRRSAHRPAQHHGQHGPESPLLLLGLDHPAHLQIHTGKTLVAQPVVGRLQYERILGQRLQHNTTQQVHTMWDKKHLQVACSLILDLSNNWAKTLK